MTHHQKGSEYFDTDSLRLDINKKAVRSGGTMLISRSANTVIQIVSTVILARLLTPDDFGLVTMVTAFSLFLFNIGFNGFTEAIIQNKGITPQQVSTIFWIGLALSTGLAILFSAFSPLLALFYHEPRIIPISIVMSSGFIFSALSTEHLALIMRNMQFHKIMVNELISAVLSVVLAVWMAKQGFGYWAIVARLLSLQIVGACIAWLQCSWRPGRPARAPGIRPMITYALNTFGSFTVNYFGQNIDKILLGWRLGSQQLGYYDRAYRLAAMPLEQIPTPLSSVALAALSRLHDDPEQYRNYFLKVVSLLSMVGMLMSVIMTVSGRDIILLLLGPKWVESGRIFMFFGPSIGIAMIYRTHGWLHLSLGNAARWFKWGLISFAITSLAFFIALPFGGLGMAVAYGLMFLILSGPALWYAAKPIGLSLGRIWAASWRYLAAALISGVATWSAAHQLKAIEVFMSGFHTWARLLLTSFVCSVFYFISVAILHRGFGPIREMIRVARLFSSRSRENSPPDVNVGGEP